MTRNDIEMHQTAMAELTSGSAYPEAEDEIFLRVPTIKEKDFQSTHMTEPQNKFIGLLRPSVHFFLKRSGTFIPIDLFVFRMGYRAIQAANVSPKSGENGTRTIGQNARCPISIIGRNENLCIHPKSKWIKNSSPAI